MSVWREAGRFPILPLYDKLGRKLHPYPASVPWALVEPHREQALRNHYQTLERLAERGGLSADELHAVVHDRAWRHMDSAEAFQWLVDVNETPPATT